MCGELVTAGRGTMEWPVLLTTVASFLPPSLAACLRRCSQWEHAPPAPGPYLKAPDAHSPVSLLLAISTLADTTSRRYLLLAVATLTVTILQLHRTHQLRDDPQAELGAPPLVDEPQVSCMLPVMVSVSKSSSVVVFKMPQVSAKANSSHDTRTL